MEIMKKPILLCLAAACALLLGACNSFESRRDEKSYVFDNLDPATQQRLKDGEIRVGDTFDMVYIALGVPDEKRQKSTSKGSQTVWIYASYQSEYRGEAFAGYRRYVVYDRLTHAYRVYHQPVTQSVYEDRVDERFRVTFENGKVTEIETAER